MTIMTKDLFQILYAVYFLIFAAIVVIALISLPPSPRKQKLGVAAGLLAIAICITTLAQNHLV